MGDFETIGLRSRQMFLLVIYAVRLCVGVRGCSAGRIKLLFSSRRTGRRILLLCSRVGHAAGLSVHFVHSNCALQRIQPILSEVDKSGLCFLQTPCVFWGLVSGSKGPFHRLYGCTPRVPVQKTAYTKMAQSRGWVFLGVWCLGLEGPFIGFMAARGVKTQHKYVCIYVYMYDLTSL